MEKLGIDPWGIVAQTVNFFIIFWLLKKFLYGPVTKILEQRKNKISQSLKDIEEIEKRLSKVEETVKNKLEIANRESDKIINQAKQDAQTIQKHAQKQAEIEAQKIIYKTETRLKRQEQQITEQVKKSTSELAASMLKKIFQDLDYQSKVNLTQKSLKKAEQALKSIS